MKTANVIQMNYTPATLFVNAEFGCANKAGALIRKSLFPLIHDSIDCHYGASLTKNLMEVVNSDPLHAWGNRHVQDGNLQLLEGFEFNARKKVSCVLMHNMEAMVNPTTGWCSIDLAPFVPRHLLRFGGNSSHVRFIGAVSCIDFKQEEFDLVTDCTQVLSLDDETSVQLRMKISPQPGKPTLLLLGIELYRFICGRFYKTGYGGNLSLRIVKAVRCIVPAA